MSSDALTIILQTLQAGGGLCVDMRAPEMPTDASTPGIVSPDPAQMLARHAALGETRTVLIVDASARMPMGLQLLLLDAPMPDRMRAFQALLRAGPDVLLDHGAERLRPAETLERRLLDDALAAFEMPIKALAPRRPEDPDRPKWQTPYGPQTRGKRRR